MNEVFIAGWRPSEVAKISETDPKRAEAISRCSNAMLDPELRVKHRNMLHNAAAAIGERWPIGNDDATKEARRKILARYDSACASGRGIVDAGAVRAAQQLDRELLEAGWDPTLIGPGAQK